MKLLVILGGGGHTTEMLKLVNLLGPDYEYHYLLVKEVNFSQDRIEMPGTVHQVRRPRGMHDSVWAAVVNSGIALAQITMTLLKVRPQAVIGCGPAISVLASIAGKLIGAKAIHVETGSRVSTLSLSGKIMYKIADLFFVQWTPLKVKHPKAIYAGRL
jgi:beta-1,4-N-acetylglucosaminyltransferase